MRADEFITEGIEGVTALANAGFKLVDLPAFTPSGTSKLVVSGDSRPIVLMDIKGTHVPFYCSTGEGGKVNVPAGKWYVFFGIGPSGWMNKGGEDSINAFYGSGLLKTYANFLNLKIGNVVEDRNLSVMKNTALAVINKDMLDPQNHIKKGQDEELLKFKKRVNAILQKLGERPYYMK